MAPEPPPDAAPLARAGELLFRWRSFTPVLLGAVAVPLIARSRGAPHGAAWLVGGLLLCSIGQVMRAWVLGQVQDGTSGQNEALIASELNTEGPYALTRNPLYLGNLCITLGLCLVAHDAALTALAALLFALQYRAIIAAEERFLLSRFGTAYEAYCARVPRFFPRFARPSGPPRPFSFQRVLRKEHNPAAAWLVLGLLLLALDRAAAARRAAATDGSAAAPSGLGLWPYAAALAGVLFLWLAVKAWKHRWLSGGFSADLRRRLRETAR